MFYHPVLSWFHQRPTQPYCTGNDICTLAVHISDISLPQVSNKSLTFCKSQNNSKKRVIIIPTNPSPKYFAETQAVPRYFPQQLRRTDGELRQCSGSLRDARWQQKRCWGKAGGSCTKQAASRQSSALLSNRKEPPQPRSSDHALL